MSERIVFKPIYLLTNQGHGNARRIALSNCTNSYVALMDADDISLAKRFQLQLNAFLGDNTLDICGGQINEFIGEVNNVVSRRVVPLGDKEIKHFLKKRCPMNQMTVMFKKKSIDDVGGYLDWYCNEDYYLWIRLRQDNCKFANLPETLVNVRVGNEMSARRGGWNYFVSELKLQKYMFLNNIISFPRLIYNITIRFIGEVLLSAKVRTKLFRLFRSEPIFEQDIIHEELDIESSRLKYPHFSVAMCVYGKDNANWFDEAIASIINQTVKPNEIVLVVDGPIPDAIQIVIDKYSEILKSKI